MTHLCEDALQSVLERRRGSEGTVQVITMRLHLILLLILSLAVVERCSAKCCSRKSFTASLSGSLNPPSVKIDASVSASTTIAGITVGGTVGGSVTANENGVSDTVTVDASASGGLLDAAKGTALAPLIDALTHVSGTYNIPTGADLLTVYQSLYMCNPDEPLDCLQSIAQAALGNCSIVGTDLTNCPVIMEQVRSPLSA